MDYFTQQLEAEFKNSSWDEVYSFIEFFYSKLNDYEKKDFEDSINRILFEEGAQYKMLNGLIISLMTVSEVNEVSIAQNQESIASRHITNAIELFNRRPNPDYSNSIKESISALEAVAREITGKPSSVLSDAVKKMKLHPQLEQGISKIYSWTSDEGGIRHAVKDGNLNHGESEARCILVLSSALLNYLIEKNKNI